MSLLARRHNLLYREFYGEIIHHGTATSPADGGSNSGSPVTITPPASMLAGDLVITVLSTRSGNSHPISHSNLGGQTWTTLIDYNAVSGDGMSVKVQWCVFNGTWSTNPQWTFSGTAGRPRSGQMHVFRSTSSWFSSWGFDGYNGGGLSTSSPNVIIGRTTLHASTISIAIWYIVNNSTWSSLSGTGWVNLGAAQYRNIIGLNQTTSYAYRALKLPMATGNVQKNVSTATFGVQFLYSFYQILTV